MNRAWEASWFVSSASHLVQCILVPRLVHQGAEQPMLLLEQRLRAVELDLGQA
jgi:hypothetical protein